MYREGLRSEASIRDTDISIFIIVHSYHSIVGLSKAAI